MNLCHDRVGIHSKIQMTPIVVVVAVCMTIASVSSIDGVVLEVATMVSGIDNSDDKERFVGSCSRVLLLLLLLLWLWLVLVLGMDVKALKCDTIRSANLY